MYKLVAQVYEPLFVPGVTYNIPVCVWLQENHPYVPPLVYVKPTNTMAIKPSQFVDSNGNVYHPFLHEWTYVCSLASTFVISLYNLWINPVIPRSDQH